MRAWTAIGLCVLAFAPCRPAPAASGVDAEARVPTLAVPYVPQSGVLCGGAAVAMVLRYWGEPGVWAEDFAPLAGTESAGIRTGDLVGAVAARGWTALPLPGTPDVARGHLAGGRPLVALIRVGAGAFHYIVLAGWSGGRVVYHDPKIGPLRTLDEDAFLEAWSASANWALLILPPDRSVAAPSVPAAPATPDTTRASPLLASASACFRAGDWTGAIRLAEQALAETPDDTDVWRLLAGSRFLAGDVEGALRAWNRLGEPTTDLLRLDGLQCIRYAAVADQLGLPHGRVLAPSAWRRARHRLAEVPALASYRLGLRPRPGGLVQVEAALLERSRLGAAPLDAARTILRAVVQREVAVAVTSPTGNGELWTAAWRWWPQRPRVLVAVAVPAVGGRPGLWRVEGRFEQQAYRLAPTRGHDLEGAAGAVVREERRRAALSAGDWLAADLRLELTLALDTWQERGSHLALGGRVETRLAHDRLTLAATTAGWRGRTADAAFATLDLGADWHPAEAAPRGAWALQLGLTGVTNGAPRDLWPGAGTGEGRDPLLRAHPLLRDNVIDSPLFGRRLAHLSLERQAWPWQTGPLRAGWAVFVDAAGAGATGRAEPPRWQVDGGVGLRAGSPTQAGQWRLDVAHGLVDGHWALSLAWQGP